MLMLIGPDADSPKQKDGLIACRVGPFVGRNPNQTLLFKRTRGIPSDDNSFIVDSNSAVVPLLFFLLPSHPRIHRSIAKPSSMALPSATIRFSQAATNAITGPATRRSTVSTLRFYPVPDRTRGAKLQLQRAPRCASEDESWTVPLLPEDLVEPTGHGVEGLLAYATRIRVSVSEGHGYADTAFSQKTRYGYVLNFYVKK